MPKPSTYPIIINQAKTLTTGFLSKCGYFKTDYKTTGSTGWISNKSKNLDIDIIVIMTKDKERVILKYIDFDNNQVEQIIYLYCKPSNLGKGLIWFFICPFIGATCRNLIFVHNRFMHSSNLLNAMYGTQAESKRWRKIFQLQPNIPNSKTYLLEPKARFYKRYYNGQMTKRYKKYLNTISKWDANQKKTNH